MEVQLQHIRPANVYVRFRKHRRSSVVLEPAMQTSFSVTTQRHGTMIVQPSDELYAKHSVVATNGIVHVEPNIPFRILVANFGTTPKRLVKNQVLGELLPHPTLVVPTHVKFAEVLGLVNSDPEKTRPDPEMKTCETKPGNPE